MVSHSSPKTSVNHFDSLKISHMSHVTARASIQNPNMFSNKIHRDSPDKNNQKIIRKMKNPCDDISKKTRFWAFLIREIVLHTCANLINEITARVSKLIITRIS